MNANFRTLAAAAIAALSFANVAHADRPEIDLIIAGNCPDPIMARVNHASPDARVVVVRGQNEGATLVDGGPCPGLELEVAGSVRKIGAFWADSNGTGMVHADVTPYDACGDWLQVVDLDTCTASDPTPIYRQGEE